MTGLSKKICSYIILSMLLSGFYWLSFASTYSPSLLSQAEVPLFSSQHRLNKIENWVISYLPQNVYPFSFSSFQRKRLFSQEAFFENSSQIIQESYRYIDRKKKFLHFRESGLETEESYIQSMQEMAKPYRIANENSIKYRVIALKILELHSHVSSDDCRNLIEIFIEQERNESNVDVKRNLMFDIYEISQIFSRLDPEGVLDFLDTISQEYRAIVTLGMEAMGENG